MAYGQQKSNRDNETLTVQARHSSSREGKNRNTKTRFLKIADVARGALGLEKQPIRKTARMPCLSKDLFPYKETVPAAGLVQQSDRSRLTRDISLFDRQKLFEKAYLQIRKQMSAIKDEQYEIDSMFSSLMQKAFNGDLNIKTKAA